MSVDVILLQFRITVGLGRTCQPQPGGRLQICALQRRRSRNAYKWKPRRNWNIFHLPPVSMGTCVNSTPWPTFSILHFHPCRICPHHLTAPHQPMATPKGHIRQLTKKRGQILDMRCVFIATPLPLRFMQF